MVEQTDVEKVGFGAGLSGGGGGGALVAQLGQLLAVLVDVVLDRRRRRFGVVPRVPRHQPLAVLSLSFRLFSVPIRDHRMDCGRHSFR